MILSTKQLKHSKLLYAGNGDTKILNNAWNWRTRYFNNASASLKSYSKYVAKPLSSFSRNLLKYLYQYTKYIMLCVFNFKRFMRTSKICVHISEYNTRQLEFWIIFYHFRWNLLWKYLQISIKVFEKCSNIKKMQTNIKNIVCINIYINEEIVIKLSA